MPSDDKGILRVNGQGEVLVADVRKYLSAIENAYNGAYVFEIVMERIQELQRNEEPIFGFFLDNLLGRSKKRRVDKTTDKDVLFLLSSWPPTEKRIASFVPSEDKLVLKSVVLQSPGTWEFIAKLNPLENLRLFLQDHHERRKDKKYREVAEVVTLAIQNERMQLENRKLEQEVKRAVISNEIAKIKVVQEKMKILKEVGVSEEAYAALVNELISKPFDKLVEPQEIGIISTAEIKQISPTSDSGKALPPSEK